MKELLFALLLIISCQENNEVMSEKENVTVEKSASAIIVEKPETVALNFYQWYLRDIYLKKYVESPEIILNKEKIYVIDSKKHKEFLDSSGYFSPDFYKNELLMYRKCEAKLRSVKWQDIEESGAVNPAENVDGNDCNFTSYMIWTNGQGEVLNKAKLVKSTINGNKAEVKLELSDTIYGAKFSQPIVSLQKEKEGWKISKIRVIFEGDE